MKKLLIKFLVKYYLADVIKSIPKNKLPHYSDWDENAKYGGDGFLICRDE